MKTCTKCKVEKPFSSFAKNKRNEDGHSCQCKECVNQREKELRTNPVKQLEKAYRSSVIIENRLLLIQGKKLCCECREVFNINDLNKNNECKTCSSERAKKWKLKNKEKIDEWRRKNRERINRVKKEYRAKNIEKTREQNRASASRRYARLKLESESKISTKDINDFMKKLESLEEYEWEKI